MNDTLRLEDLDAEAVGRSLERIVKYASWAFDADPRLKTVGPETVQFLTLGEARIIPALRSNATVEDAVRDPEGTLGSLFVELASRYVENQVLREWQREYDRFCVVQFGRLYPLARELSGTESLPSTAIQVRIEGSERGARFVLLNTSDRPLTHVSLRLSLEALGGEKQAEFLYFETLGAKSTTPFRVPVDWWGLGAWRTWAVELEAACDEARSEPRRVVFPETVQREVRLRIAAARAQAKSDRAAALRAIADAKRIARENSQPALLEECDAVRRPIVAGLQEEQTKLTTQIKQAAKQKSDLQDELAKRPSDAGLRTRYDRSKQELERLKDQAEQVRQLRSIE